MRKRPRKRFDHGEPIAKIDTRPLAFVANQTRVHALIIELPEGFPPEAPSSKPHGVIE
ncbi:MAG: hypothetical protein ABJ205_09760 [Erythrobacter sp.]|uniref:hypothetical protein n=1 Tax=Erythrobacter sp. TaxID=1042 RepID=UPI0032641EDD